MRKSLLALLATAALSACQDNGLEEKVRAPQTQAGILPEAAASEEPELKVYKVKKGLWRIEKGVLPFINEFNIEGMDVPAFYFSAGVSAHLLVSATDDAGIREIRIYDGDTLVQTYDAGGKQKVAARIQVQLPKEQWKSEKDEVPVFGRRRDYTLEVVDMENNIVRYGIQRHVEYSGRPKDTAPKIFLDIERTKGVYALRVTVTDDGDFNGIKEVVVSQLDFDRIGIGITGGGVFTGEGLRTFETYVPFHNKMLTYVSALEFKVEATDVTGNKSTERLVIETGN